MPFASIYPIHQSLKFLRKKYRDGFFRILKMTLSELMCTGLNIVHIKYMENFSTIVCKSLILVLFKLDGLTYSDGPATNAAHWMANLIEMCKLAKNCR